MAIVTPVNPCIVALQTFDKWSKRVEVAVPELKHELFAFWHCVNHVVDWAVEMRDAINCTMDQACAVSVLVFFSVCKRPDLVYYQTASRHHLVSFFDGIDVEQVFGWYRTVNAATSHERTFTPSGQPTQEGYFELKPK